MPKKHGVQADVPDDLPCIPTTATTATLLARWRHPKSARAIQTRLVGARSVDNASTHYLNSRSV